MSIKPVSNLYLITYEDGTPYKTTRDAKEAVDAIGAGFKVEEFVSLENHRAAMLKAEPVTTANKLPKTEFKQVADLYEMQFDDGRTCAFHTDAKRAVQWLNVCEGHKVQEYVKLERLQEVVSGNSPAIPDGYVMVPKEPTEKMVIAGFEAELIEEIRNPDGWEEYEAMSGCEQAAQRAKWCWSAMVKAAQKKDFKP